MAHEVTAEQWSETLGRLFPKGVRVLAENAGIATDAALGQVMELDGVLSLQVWPSRVKDLFYSLDGAEETPEGNLVLPNTTDGRVLMRPLSESRF